MNSAMRRLRGGWRRIWSLLPPSLLPWRLRLGAILRRLLGRAAVDASGFNGLDHRAYADWIERHDRLGADDRAAIARHIAAMPVHPLISVVMPTYETPEAQLRAAVASVRAQLWPHWELCIADDASPSPHVAQVLAELAAAEPRIRWMRRERNGHISAASNSALALAQGDWVALMDHDDLLPEHALYEVAAEIAAHPDAGVIYSDEDKIDGDGRRFAPYFKPDFDPDLLLAQNVISHLGCYRRDVMVAIGGFREGFEGSQDHDLALRATERVGAARVRHVPAVLYHWRQTGAAQSFSETQLARCTAASRQAVAEVLASRGVVARLAAAPLAPTHTRVIWPLPDPPPLVSVIVPTRDRAGLLAACARGVLARTDYPAIELLVVDNDSVEPATLALFAELRADPRVRILASPGPFNYSAMNNQAAAAARGAVLLLLNNDVEVIDGDWLREMVSLALRPEVGAVGAKLLFGDGTLQHGGVVIGAGGVAGHYLPRSAPNDTGQFGSLALVREVSAVTGACLALRRSVYEEVGGLDAEHLAVAFNDVDLCLRIRRAGYRILWTPFAELYHLESVSRGQDITGAKARRFAAEIRTMEARWGPSLQDDPFYSPNLDRNRSTGSLADPPRRRKPWADYLPHAR